MKMTKHYAVLMFLGLIGLSIDLAAPARQEGIFWWGTVALLTVLIHGFLVMITGVSSWKAFWPAAIFTAAIFTLAGLHTYGVVVLPVLVQVMLLVGLLLVPSYYAFIGIFGGIKWSSKERKASMI